ncbi:MAG: hypothetical protein EP343_11275 [Deltaproteobacteria bacterium]|nr:MAG: hypothetical protein EP343_11275 [Deltaproteobacteria bacterium]
MTGQHPRSSLLFSLSLSMGLFFILFLGAFGCSQPPCFHDGIGPLSINPEGYVCQHRCECNNQGYHGACIQGRCKVWKERAACPIPHQSLEAHRTNVLLDELCPALTVQDIAQCPSGTFRKICQDKELHRNVWGDCVCAGTPCPPNQTLCSTDCSPYQPCNCIDLQTNAQHCGVCGQVCENGTSCIKGQCQCPSTKAMCPITNVSTLHSPHTTCVDIQRNPQHCGTCGNSCEEGSLCVQGRCQEALLQPGSYTRGTPYNEIDWTQYTSYTQIPKERETPHRVTLTRPFYMGRFEVTQGWFQSVMGYSPETKTPCSGESQHCPVVGVSLHQAMDFCNKLSQQAKLPVCYQCKNSGTPNVRCQEDINNPSQGIYHCQGYRLPTDAEWEFAARSGSEQPFPGGTPAQQPLHVDQTYTPYLSPFAWYKTNSNNQLHPVGTRQPNNWKLYDMRGNAAEWVSGATSFVRTSLVDPWTPLQKLGTLRGGSYSQPAILLRSGARQMRPTTYTPEDSRDSIGIGFRVARTAKHSPLCPQSGLSFCGIAGCIDTLQNPKHCGQCNRVCSRFQDCQNGQCVRPEVLIKTQDEQGKPLPWTMGYKLPHYIGKECFRNDTPPHQVKFNHNFYAWSYEVQQQEFGEMLGFNPSRRPCKTCPVETVTWSQALAFANAMSRHFGLEPCYQCQGDPKKPAALRCMLRQKFQGNQNKDYYKCPGYRLPTEAEWEYMVREAGQKPSYCQQVIDRGIYKTDDYNRYTVDFDPLPIEPQILPVGTPSPTDLGLYDLHQNVREWVWDAYLPDYGHHQAPDQASIDPVGWPQTSLNSCKACPPSYNRFNVVCLPCYRVLRGGHFAQTYTEDWDEVKRYYRHINHDRTDGSLDSRPWHIGFRVVRTQLPAPTTSQGGQP